MFDLPSTIFLDKSRPVSYPGLPGRWYEACDRGGRHLSGRKLDLALWRPAKISWATSHWDGFLRILKMLWQHIVQSLILTDDSLTLWPPVVWWKHIEPDKPSPALLPQLPHTEWSGGVGGGQVTTQLYKQSNNGIKKNQVTEGSAHYTAQLWWNDRKLCSLSSHYA